MCYIRTLGEIKFEQYGKPVLNFDDWKEFANSHPFIVDATPVHGLKNCWKKYLLDENRKQIVQFFWSRVLFSGFGALNVAHVGGTESNALAATHAIADDLSGEFIAVSERFAELDRTIESLRAYAVWITTHSGKRFLTEIDMISMDRGGNVSSYVIDSTTLRTKEGILSTAIDNIALIEKSEYLLDDIDISNTSETNT